MELLAAAEAPGSGLACCRPVLAALVRCARCICSCLLTLAMGLRLALFALLLLPAWALEKHRWPVALFSDLAADDEAQLTCAAEPPQFLEDLPAVQPRHLANLRSSVSTAQGEKALSRYRFQLEKQVAKVPNRICKGATDNIKVLVPLVIPHLKLAFCYVPKVACTQFKDLFNTLNQLPKGTLGFGHNYLSSGVKALHLDARHMTKREGWKFAAFTRDPALRYLSAFGSTCVPTRTGYEHSHTCCGPTVGKGANLERMITSFEDRVLADRKAGLPALEDHWVPQVEVLKNCGWDKFGPQNLDYWGQLSGDVNAKVKEMFRMVNGSTEEINEAVDNYFPPGKIAGHRNPMDGDPRDYFRNETILAAIGELYSDDYAMLPGVGCSFSRTAETSTRQASQSR
mmetsp:Transcript_37529/g.113322  ORF Transcript_37529/g.113322 Transcript_37529/m.113322 type:complete len:399 (+) Transcript_37529:3-1199(+)